MRKYKVDRSTGGYFGVHLVQMNIGQRQAKQFKGVMSVT